MNERHCGTHYTGFRHKASCRGETVPLAISSTGGAAGVALDGAKRRQKNGMVKVNIPRRVPGQSKAALTNSHYIMWILFEVLQYFNLSQIPNQNNIQK